MNKHALRPLAAALALAFALPALADKQLGDVTVSSGRSVGAKPVLRDEIVATESIGARELEKTGATMLTEALDKRPGISVQTECSICNVRNVVLNNLPGRGVAHPGKGDRHQPSDPTGCHRLRPDLWLRLLVAQGQ